MLSFLACTTFLLSVTAAQNQSSEYVVDLGYAKYRGVLNDSYTE